MNKIISVREVFHFRNFDLFTKSDYRPVKKIEIKEKAIVREVLPYFGNLDILRFQPVEPARPIEEVEMNILEPSIAKKITGGKCELPTFEIEGGLFNVVSKLKEIYEFIAETETIKFLDKIKRTESPMNKKDTDQGLGICFVVFHNEGKYYVATSRAKHDFCVDYRKMDNLVHAGKILGLDEGGVVHINDQSGSFHMRIKKEELDKEFISTVRCSDTVIINLYEDYLHIKPLKKDY